MNFNGGSNDFETQLVGFRKEGMHWGTKANKGNKEKQNCRFLRCLGSLLFKSPHQSMNMNSLLLKSTRQALGKPCLRACDASFTRSDSVGLRLKASS